MPLYTLTIKETLNSSGVAPLPPILQYHLWPLFRDQRDFLGRVCPAQAGDWTAPAHSQLSQCFPANAPS